MSFLFQAKDGIRDLVQSSGLGNVYQRQVWGCCSDPGCGGFAMGGPVGGSG